MVSGRLDIPPGLIDVLTTARHVTVLTGAGISAESGIPTFRDAQTGLWARYRPEELATPEAFAHNPRLVWDWYAWRRELVARANPNRGHLVLAEMEKRFPAFTLITQNVDGLHQRAGNCQVLELHGCLGRIKCSRENRIVAAWDQTPELPPRCPYCGSLLRPDVVWFGEALPEETLEAACQAARLADVFFTVGTSAIVQPAAQLPYVALQGGAVVVEINLAETPFSQDATYFLNGPAGMVLPALLEVIP